MSTRRLVMWRQEQESADIFREVVEREITEHANGLLALDFFNDLSGALSSTEGSVGLITELGRRTSRKQEVYPAEPLIWRAYELGVPTAILSGSPDAQSFVFPEVGGVLLEKQDPEVMREKMGIWISGLVVGL